MASFPVHAAKTHLSRLIERACQGEEIVIQRGSEPVVRLVPVNPAPSRRAPGRWKGRIVVGPGFFEPLPAEELEGWG